MIGHVRALAASGDDRIEAVPGDLTNPPGVLATVRDTGLIDWAKPAYLILAMVLHICDAATARDIAAAYTAALAPGSYVIITVGHGDEKIARQVISAYDAATLYNHTPEEAAAFFAGLDLVKPGLVDARSWTPGWPQPPAIMLPDGQIVVGVARKPPP